MVYILKSLEPYWITGFSLLGGDPFEPENQETVHDILGTIRESYPTIDIWAYTGYVYEDLIDGGKCHTNRTNDILLMINTLVDGPYTESKKDISLAFRGSRNQRVLDLDYIRELKERGDEDGYRRYFRSFSGRS